MAAAKEQIRQIISENNISSVADLYSLLKESFKDILQELMEADLFASISAVFNVSRKCFIILSSLSFDDVIIYLQKYIFSRQNIQTHESIIAKFILP